MAMSNKVARNPTKSHQTARELGATAEMFFVFYGVLGSS
jgi:hypothetical protein